MLLSCEGPIDTQGTNSYIIIRVIDMAHVSFFRFIMSIPALNTLLALDLCWSSYMFIMIDDIDIKKD